MTIEERRSVEKWSLSLATVFIVAGTILESLGWKSAAEFFRIESMSMYMNYFIRQFASPVA